MNWQASDHSTQELLAQYAAILVELRNREVVRTRNAPLGDYAEYLAQRAFGGELQPNSEKSYDLLDPSGSRIQVKARTIGEGVHASAKFSAFRSFDFDNALFLALDLGTYRIEWARLVARQEVEDVARYSPHINGSSLRITKAAKMGEDVTERVRAAS
ncbi:MAG: hypothetical protein JWP32_972 [Schumannella sp.]|nr:hypothetical protein [Schumannella sp.]